MNALELIANLTDALFAVIGGLTVAHAFRERTRTSIDIALLFVGLAFLALEQSAVRLLHIEPGAQVGVVVAVVFVALASLMVRLLADFTAVPLLVRLATVGGLIASVVLLVAYVDRLLPPPATLFVLAYVAVTAAYVAAGFVRLSRRSSGVTRRRTQAVAAGNALLGLALAILGVAIVVPAAAPLVGAAVQLLGLAAATAWLLGFAPPPQLRRYWQEPELRGFFERARTLPRLRDTSAILRELERRVGEVFGARAAIGLWDPDRRVVRFESGHGALPPEVAAESDFLAARVLASQRAEFFPDASAAHPAHAAAYRSAGVGSVLLAPITAGERRIGVLEAFAPGRPIFSSDDLSLVRLLADQAAVMLETRFLIDEAAGLRAQEEAARLKEDFVSAAAHDLKTPLTTLLGQAQILELRFSKDPALSVHLPGVGRIAREARRLSSLVEDLLDASRIEQGRLEMRREPCDVASILRDVGGRSRRDGERVQVDISGALTGRFDRRRVEQLVDNLVENGLKYSPADAPVEVRGWREDHAVRIAVQDHGIGIPVADRPYVFERFHRASNVDARRYAGIGLGLYICRGIAEEHGGRIWVESAVGQGSTFHVALPDAPEVGLN